MSDMDVVPSHLSGAPMYDGGAFGNMRMRPGEVQAIYYKTDPQNISKKYIEYDVYCGHRSGHTATSKMYNHVFAMDRFGGVADTFTFTFRPDKSASRSPLKPGLGSKVLLLCVNGENNNACIIGGLRDASNEPDDPALGHNLHFRWNGIDITINKDGELLLERQGPQEMDGSLRSDIDEKTTGTTISMDVKGNVEISDAVKDGDSTVAKNIILLNHAENKIEITGDAEVNLNGPKITTGDSDATEPFLLGNQWASLMKDLISAILSMTVPTPEGPSGTCFNFAQFQQIQSRLQSILSKVSFTK